MPDVAPPSIAALRLALNEGRQSVREALAWQRNAFERGSGAFRCVIDRAPSEAPLAGAPLEGIALAHKDVFATGLRAPGQGRPAGMAGAPGKTATVLERLATRGASRLGALAMAEFACGATAENPHGPEPLNPLDPDAAVGGSSSGSAVAVAAGMCYASLGTDTAGSIRIPASTCGLVGLKPGQGLIDGRGVCRLAPSLDTVGVVARSASDAAHVFAALLPDDAPMTRRLYRLDGIETELGRHRHWRVASALDQANLRVDIENRLAAFDSHVASRVASFRRAALPDLERLGRLAQVVLHVEAAHTHAFSVRHALRTLAPITQSILLPGLAVPAAWYRQACEARDGLRAEFIQRHLDEADVLLTPSLPRGVPDWRAVKTTSDTFDARELVALHRYHAFVNYLGLPAIVFPIGLDDRGRPVCLQAIGAPGTEERLLAFAHQFAAPAPMPHLH